MQLEGEKRRGLLSSTVTREPEGDVELKGSFVLFVVKTIRVYMYAHGNS